jgi:hypothetical protein
MGRMVTDVQGERLGRVIDTWPYDGGGEVEMVVLRLSRLGESRMVPVAWMRDDGDGGLRSAYARWQVEDSPALEDGKHAVAAEERARSHWSWEEPAEPDTLLRRWQRSSGSSGTARRSRTSPSPTTTAS